MVCDSYSLDLSAIDKELKKDSIKDMKILSSKTQKVIKNGNQKVQMLSSFNYPLLVYSSKGF